MRTVAEESNTGWGIERIEVSDGVKVYVPNAPFPMKTLPYPEAIAAINISKRLVVETARMLSRWQFWISYPFLVLGFKAFLGAFLKGFNRISESALADYVNYRHVRPEGIALTRPAQEISVSVRAFLESLGVDGASETALIFSHIIEYDSAYRFRLQDLASASSKEALLSHPGRELRRLALIVKERELSPQTARKVSNALILFSLSLLRPSIYRAFVSAIEQTDFSKFAFDDGDLYWAFIRTDYDPLGKTFKERQAFLKERGWNVPQPENLLV